MNKKFLLLIFFLSSVNIYTETFADSIVYVDMNKILTTSKPGSLMIDKLNKLEKKNIKDFNEIEKVIKDKDKKLVAQKNILSEVEFKKSIDKLRLEIKDYREDRKKIIQNFNKLKIKNTNELLSSINPILTKYADENSITLILQKKNLIMGKSEVDISNHITELINE